MVELINTLAYLLRKSMEEIAERSDVRSLATLSDGGPGRLVRSATPIPPGGNAVLSRPTPFARSEGRPSQRSLPHPGRVDR